MLAWYRQGVDVNAQLTILATYMGHVDLAYTQQYLHLTTELAEEMTKRLERDLGHIIPGGR
jgi:integrase/recombinase XerD